MLLDFFPAFVQFCWILYKALVSEEIHPPFAGRTFPGVTKMFLFYFVRYQEAATFVTFSVGVTNTIGLILDQGFFPVVGLERGMILDAGESEEASVAGLPR